MDKCLYCGNKLISGQYCNMCGAPLDSKKKNKNIVRISLNNTYGKEYVLCSNS